MDDEQLADLRLRVNRAATGEIIAEASTALRESVGPDGTGALPAVVETLVEAMSDHRSTSGWRSGEPPTWSRRAELG